MRVRITSGKFGSRFIKTLPTLRPMMEMARKAMFDVLGDRVEDSHFLDLFAGSGAGGIEALSRDATHATFVEHDNSHYKLIIENLKSLGLEGEATVRKSEVAPFIAKTHDTFDIVFAAPWYKDVKELDITGWEKLLSNDGILVLEHEREDAAPIPPGLELIQTKTYGHTALTFYRASA